MLNNEKNRTYVFKDTYTNREIEVGYIGAAGYFNQGSRGRMQFVRSFIPKVMKTEKMKRDDGSKKVAYDKISEYEETDVQTALPSFAKPMIKSHKQPKTWLDARGTELPEPPDGFDR